MKAWLWLVVALAGFLAGVRMEGWRLGAKETQRVQQELEEQRRSAAAAVRRVDNVITAQNAATAREVGLRRDADGVRVALVGLHDATASVLREAEQSQAACLERATTLGELFEASAGRYSAVAGKAAGHASDVQKLMDAWPVE